MYSNRRLLGQVMRSTVPEYAGNDECFATFNYRRS